MKNKTTHEEILGLLNDKVAAYCGNPNPENYKEVFAAVSQFTGIAESRIAAEVVVDLYEARAVYMPATKSSMYERAYNAFKYNFFCSEIAAISSKYNVRSEDIEEALRRRSKEDHIYDVLGV